MQLLGHPQKIDSLEGIAKNVLDQTGHAIRLAIDARCVIKLD